MQGTCCGSVLRVCLSKNGCACVGVIECVRVCLCGKCDRDVVFELIDVSHAVLRKRCHVRCHVTETWFLN